MSRNWIDLDWNEKTFNEKFKTILTWILALVESLIIFGVGLIVLGQSLDGISRYNSEHRRCLQHATNGYEIEQCR